MLQFESAMSQGITSITLTSHRPCKSSASRCSRNVRSCPQLGTSKNNTRYAAKTLIASMGVEAKIRYHHHSILLVRPEIAPKIIRRVFSSSDAKSCMVDLGHRQKTQRRVITPVRSCHIQTLATLEDIEHAASYAAKALRVSMAVDPDASYFLFP